MPLKPLRPKVIATIMKGMTSTPNMWMRPTMAEFSATVLSPASVRAAPPLMVVRPAPPQEHGVASPSRARAMDVMGSKPSATRNGAAIAAGAPAPAAPSRKMGSIIPMMTTCTRRSSLMRAMVPLTSSIAPVARSRFRITKAPNTISTIFSPSLMPFHSRASYTATFSLNVAPVTLKYVKASTSVQISATGATRLADWRNPRIPTNTTMIGLSAITKFRKPMVAFSLSMHKYNDQRSGHTRPACRWGPRRPCAGRTQEVAFIKKRGSAGRRSLSSHLSVVGLSEKAADRGAMHRSPLTGNQVQQQDKNGRQQSGVQNNDHAVVHRSAGESGTGVLCRCGGIHGHGSRHRRTLPFP